MIYSHVMLEDVTPRVVPLSEAIVTPLGVRICPRVMAKTSLHLMEIVELQKKPRKKVSLCLWQNPLHPEMTYCRCGSELFRLRWLWAVTMLSGELIGTPFEKSDIWRFAHDAEFLGSFHDLDASVAVFRQGYHTSASIFRPQLVSRSFVEQLPRLPSSQTSINEPPLNEALEQIENQDFEPVKAAFQQFEYVTLDAAQFDASLEKLGDRSAVLQNQTSELEAIVRHLNPQTSQTVQCTRIFNQVSWMNEAIHNDFQRIQEHLNEIEHNNNETHQM